MDKIKIAIVDDHQLFRDGLYSLLSSHEHFTVILSADNGRFFFQQLEKDNLPDVILLDLTMPEMDGFEVLKKLRKGYKTIKTIALSMHDDGNYIMKCARSGAYGYLLKNTDADELVEAINQVHAGKKYFNKAIADRMINIMAIEGSTTKKLSARETEVLSLISKGHTTKEIASQLYISTRTVETHRVNMMKKLAVKNVAELIKKASQLNIF